jgi:hypothetical protein
MRFIPNIYSIVCFVLDSTTFYMVRPLLFCAPKRKKLTFIFLIICPISTNCRLFFDDFIQFKIDFLPNFCVFRFIVYYFSVFFAKTIFFIKHKVFFYAAKVFPEMPINEA